jgi:limonene-1,2-epoxide hydrolase
MRIAATLFVLLALTACGGRSSASPRDVVRAWSAALDRNDNEAAASLFAATAEVIQNGGLTKLESHADAVRWNSLLPCGGDITSLSLQGKQQVVAVFRLKERPGHACDAPGAQAAAIFEVKAGKIVVWHQTAVPAPAASGLFA